MTATDVSKGTNKGTKNEALLKQLIRKSPTERNLEDGWRMLRVKRESDITTNEERMLVFCRMTGMAWA